MARIDLHSYIGKKINMLTIIGIIEDEHEDKFLCECECGEKKAIRNWNVRSGKVKSCGCLHRKGNNRKHGKSYTSTYRYWVGFLYKLRSQKAVYDKAWEDFEVFLKELGERKGSASIIKVDESGIYEKSNVIWKK